MIVFSKEIQLFLENTKKAACLYYRPLGGIIADNLFFWFQPPKTARRRLQAMNFCSFVVKYI